MKKKKSDMFVSCIVAAGGKGSRMGADINKIFLDILDIPVIAHTLLVLQKNAYIDEIIIVSAECDLAGCCDIVREFDITKAKTVTVGGAERQNSVHNGLREVSEKSDIVLVHDAARPLVTDEHLTEVILAAKEHGAAALGVFEKNTLKLVDDDGFIISTVDRSKIISIHTPQAFSYQLINEMYKNADENNILGTDDCFFAEQLGKRIKLVPDNYENIKITTKDDIIIAEQILLSR